MLESLYVTKSRIRQGLLGLVFANPSQRYYLRELQRTLGYSAGSMRRELLRFQRDDLFSTQYSPEEYRHKRITRTDFITDLLRNPKIMLIGKEGDL